MATASVALALSIAPHVGAIIERYRDSTHDRSATIVGWMGVCVRTAISMAVWSCRNQFLCWGDAVPVPADYTGDGRHDLAVYLESSGMWYIRTMGTKRIYAIQLGGPGWSACPADYDGDGLTDPAMIANNNWKFWFSSSGYRPSGPYLLNP